MHKTLNIPSPNYFLILNLQVYFLKLLALYNKLHCSQVKMSSIGPKHALILDNRKFIKKLKKKKKTLNNSSCTLICAMTFFMNHTLININL